MNRRAFVKNTLITAPMCRDNFWRTAVADVPSDLRVTRIVGFILPSRRPKLVGKNSRKGVHGDSARDRMIRIYTNHGVEGLGTCNANKNDVGKLLGTNPFKLFDADRRRMLGPLGVGTMPLWDLAGKVLNRPAFELLGGKGDEHVPAYDGSIYFSDLLPQYAARWPDRFKQEIDMGLAAGHRGFKVKVGRGGRWMKRGEGDRRDIQVIRLIRKHAGDDVLIGVDANNGYDLAGAKKFLTSVADEQLAFAEEMFPETVEHCLEFKQHIRSLRSKTLLADGESHREPSTFKPYIAAKAMDVLQGDMKRFGFEGILTEAEMAGPNDIRVAPHNWGSLLGYYMQLHIGRAIDNFYMAERDPLSTKLLIAEGYALKDGMATVPASPGFGLKINEEKFKQQIKPMFDLTI